MLPIFSLNGKTLLITGASSGIGSAVAQQCAAAGANCIITGRNINRLERVLRTLNDESHKIIPADLTKISEIEELVASLPILDGIVCCAGIVETTILRFTNDNDLSKIFESNTFSVIRLVRSIVQAKRISKGASIVIVSSISGVRCGYIGGALYGASKGALEGFVKATALELAPRKIRVNTVVPGMINTPLLSDGPIDREQLEKDMEKYPLKRYGEPEEVGYTAVFLLSDASKWITGTSITIDGGYTLK